MLQQATTQGQTAPQLAQSDRSFTEHSLFKGYHGSLQQLDISASSTNLPKHNSSQIDNLLQFSFVQIDRFVQRQESTVNLQSLDSFFQKKQRSLLFQYGKQSQKMNHKKIQCQIGKRQFFPQNQAQASLLHKFKTLQVLKMIKLIRMIFKKLRLSIAAIKIEANLNIRQTKKYMIQMGGFFLEKISRVDQSLEAKCSKIYQLERQTLSLNEQNVRLKKELDFQLQQNQRLLQHIEDQAEKNHLLISKLQQQNEQKAIELAQTIDSCQIVQQRLSQEINHLNDTLLDNERQFRKLQYQKRLLQAEYSDLSKKNQELLKKQEENEFSFNEQSVNQANNQQEINQLARLNEFYLKEIQSCKQQMQKLKDENREIKRQSQMFLAQQLENLGEYFQQKYEQLQSKCNNNPACGHHFHNQPNQTKVQKSKQKAKNSQLLQRQNSNSLKNQNQFYLASINTNHCSNGQKQNKNASKLEHKRPIKHLSQQMKQGTTLENIQRCVSSAITLTPCLETEQALIFKAKLHQKGKIKLADFVLLETDESAKKKYNTNNPIGTIQQPSQLSNCRKVTSSSIKT